MGSIKHKKHSLRADDGDPGDVNPSDWNDDHDVDGLLGALLALAVRSGSVPYIAEDGSPALADITAPGRAILGGSTFAAILAAIGAVAKAGDTMSGALAMGGNSITGLPTPGSASDAATKAYVDALAAVVSGALVFKGGWDASSGAFPGGGAASLGWFYKVDVAGTLGGQTFTVGDDVFALVNNASVVNYTGNWLKVEGSITRAEIETAIGFVLGSAAALDAGVSANNLVKLDGSGKLPAVDGSQLTGFGTASKRDTGTNANNVVQLDGSGKLPAVDGSQLTNVTSTQVGGLRYDVSQTLVAGQQDQALGNLGISAAIAFLKAASVAAMRTALTLGDIAIKTLADVFAFTNATDSTSSTTGALTVAGGVGIAKTLNVGGAVSAGGTVFAPAFLSSANSRLSPQMQFMSQAGFTIPNGGNDVVAADHVYGRLCIASGDLGSAAEWLVSYEIATLVKATSTQWVEGEPAAGKCAVVYQSGFGFLIKNNTGVTATFKVEFARLV